MSDNSDYQRGYEQGIKDISERLEKFYNHLRGFTHSATVQYTVNQVKTELLNKEAII